MFAQFLTLQEVTLLEIVCLWKVYKTLEDSVHHIIMVGPYFQSHHLPPLDQIEANTSYCMCLPFQIGPCKTKAKSMHLVNSFMYHDESITELYEDAGWAFPTETYNDTILTWVHFQGFEILWQTHFPPDDPHYVALECSLSLNWLPLALVIEDHKLWTSHKHAHWTKDWNMAFNACQCYLFKYSCNPAFNAQRCLQCLIKAAKSQD